MLGSKSARRWPTRASAVRTASGAMAALTPWLRPRAIAWRSVRGPCGTVGCWAPAPVGTATSDSTSSERRIGRASGPFRGVRQHSVEVHVDESLDRLLVGERLRIKGMEETLHLGGVNQQGGKAARREAV